MRRLHATSIQAAREDFPAPRYSRRVDRLVDGVLAQLVERLVRNEKVRGSTPLGSTSLRSHAAKSEGCRAEAQRRRTMSNRAVSYDPAGQQARNTRQKDCRAEVKRRWAISNCATGYGSAGQPSARNTQPKVENPARRSFYAASLLGCKGLNHCFQFGHALLQLCRFYQPVPVSGHPSPQPSGSSPGWPPAPRRPRPPWYVLVVPPTPNAA